MDKPEKTFEVGETVYEKSFGARGEVMGDDEGWVRVRFSDDSVCSVRPSHLSRVLPLDIQNFREDLRRTGFYDAR